MILTSYVLLVVVAASAAARSSRCGTCTPKLQRKAWHTLTDNEKLSYIEAELCLMDKEATLGLPGAKNMFEELQATHQLQAGITHNVGAFLPFHRLLMFAHESLLREECGYEGAQPYWDEPHEAGKFSTSDVFDPVLGFGGNGSGEDGCITDGPFANFINSLGPGYLYTDHCITRFVNDRASAFGAQEFVDACNERKTFVEAWPCIEGRPHSAGHRGVGGLMLDPIASPGDPLFYLHHTWLDKVFWEWQALDLPARLTDIGGRNVAPPHSGPSGGGFPPGEAMQPPANAAPQIPEGDPGNETTLDHILNMFGAFQNATIAEVMDIRGGLLCYEYV